MSTFTKVNIEVSKRNEKKGEKSVKIGDIAIYVPILKDLLPFIGSEIKKDEKGQEIYEDGLPVYESDEANWIQNALLAQVKAQARNKLEPGTVNLKEANKIPENWAELIAEGTRGPGAALEIARQFKSAFSTWVSKLGLSESASNTLNTLISNKAALALQPITPRRF